MKAQELFPGYGKPFDREKLQKSYIKLKGKITQLLSRNNCPLIMAFLPTSLTFISYSHPKLQTLATNIAASF